MGASESNLPGDPLGGLTYKVVFRGKAAKQVQKISPPHFQRIQKAIDELTEDPRPIGAIKLVGEEGYCLRVGMYRILYDIDDANQVVTVYRVKHRRDVYR